MSLKFIAWKGAFAVGIVSFALGFTAPVAANNVTLRPSQPTHYLYTPMARVNPPGHLVLGFHEISYAMPGRLQVQASIMDNIGRTCLAAKYGFADNLSFGGGLATTLVNIGYHGIPPGDARLGLFLTYGLAERQDFSMAITPHTQIGSHISMGIDFGMRLTPTDFWSFIWEIGSSVDVTDPMLYLYTIGGLRIHPPKVPILFIDVGVSASEFRVDDFRPRARAYIDIMVCFITG
ncbi:MAG: hypothetical protein LBC70_08960 [Chitinispirillales bacterium]|jgi:hypothetical protein|nr:hypothetical protein [Chitinispirillales bacterium]